MYRRKSDGRWVGAVHLGYRDGRRLRRVVYGGTRAEVAGRIVELVRDQRRGLPIARASETVGHYLQQWLEMVRPTLRNSTLLSYRSIVDHHLSPAIGAIPLDKLSPARIRGLMADELESGLSPRSVQFHHAVLRRALGQALQDGDLARNAATLARPPRVPRYEVHPWHPDEARKFLAEIRGHRMEALLALALTTGLRQGEILGLRWVDVDLDSATLSVRQALESRTKTLTELKSLRSRRTIALPQLTVAALREHHKRQLEERVWAGARWRGETLNLVFTTTVGTPIDAGNLTRHFHTILSGAEIRKIRFHDLRHSAATFLLAQGISARVVMETLGHSQIGLTMNTYAHVLPPSQREAADRMDDLLAIRRGA